MDHRRPDQITWPDNPITHHDSFTATGAAAAARRNLLFSGNNSSTTTQLMNTITPCAACKLLRRRCAQECPFSPYFSPHEPHKFASVHKVFGASNVSKMITEVPESQRVDAVNSLVYEANLRLRDPVYGCMGAITALQRQVQSLEAELAAVRAEILKQKYRQAGVYALLFAGSGGNVSVASPPPIHGLAAPVNALAGMRTAVYPTAASSSTDDYSSSITNENVTYFG